MISTCQNSTYLPRRPILKERVNAIYDTEVKGEVTFPLQSDFLEKLGNEEYLRVKH